MDQVLEQVPDWIEAALSLLCGGALVMWAVTGHFYEKRLDWTGRTVLLSFGTVFIVLGLLVLLPLVIEQWLIVIGLLAYGILLLMGATDMLPIVRIAGRNKKRWMFLSGVFLIFFAVVLAVLIDFS